MVCKFCFDKPLVRATGNNGELVEVNCPVCGPGDAPSPGTSADSAQPRRESDGTVNKS